METTINQRIKEIAEKLFDGNISELARVSGVNQPALRDIVGTKQAKPRFEILNSIVDSSTLNIEAEWLLTGKGEMMKSSTVQENIIKEDTSGYSMANTLLEQLSKLTDTVLSQQKTIESLIDTNKKTVALLADNANNADAKRVSGA